MIYTLGDIGAIIAPIAKKYNIKAVWVFGSYARGEATDTSDVDLVIDDSECTVQGLAYVGMLTEIGEAFANGADVVSDRQIHQPTDRRGQKYFRREVLADMVKVYEAAAA